MMMSSPRPPVATVPTFPNLFSNPLAATLERNQHQNNFHVNGNVNLLNVNLPKCKSSQMLIFLNVNLPNVNLPNVNLPNVNLPNVNLLKLKISHVSSES